MSVMSLEQSLAEPALRGPKSVEAIVNYLRPMADRPWSDVVDQTKRNYEIEPTMVRIENAWPMVERLSLKDQGFIVRKHVSAITDYHDDAALMSVYAREMEALVKELTGADKAVVLETPVTRFSGRSRIQPAYNVHMDFTYEGLANRMVERGIDLTSPEYRDFNRICVYQTWRALSGPGQGSALAFADGHSVPAKDAIEADFIRYHLDSEPGYNQFFLCNPNPDHRWYYFPRLEQDELLVWTGLDPADRAMLPMHTAFIDATEQDAPPRDSIETRVYTFFRD
ncbi:CmcJ/NvfI family oxidoreductase [Sphingomonas sp. AOB5]|uniref:CmcJ/NvfI family oxidoreductase n=1 Tax=Sphingomonas sp. AOB5 TaxID=3034017 RepID=UPI0023F80A22|nr:CmcJ/NvfI family oxidoreductase [Sphingomonas sp. AOB5]MDF7774866.1 CmcJ/NvfI family oxidoreductase [Sphingomonas sp. AOB5]